MACAIAAAITAGAIVVPRASAQAQAPAPHDDDAWIYAARPGDSLELLAAEEYGDRGDVIILVAANKLVKPKPLHNGEKIRVPRNHFYVTKPGDRLDAIAQAELGDRRRAWLLAERNHLVADAPLSAGVELDIPAQLEFTAAGPEPLSAIASQYLRDGGRADELRRYNQLDRDQIERGETIAIPLAVTVRHPAPLTADAEARLAAAKTAAAAIADALPQARAAWRAGDPGRVRELLRPLAANIAFAPAAVAGDLELWLGKAELAFDDPDSQQRAGAAFRAAIAHGKASIRPFDESPKVRAAWTAAGGTVDGDAAPSGRAAGSGRASTVEGAH